jgi:AraC-like DNA-binding protein/quercetin dioxygenase-like cupin family protein
MSRKRQAAFFDREGDKRSQITTLTHDYAPGHVIALHFHDWDQLVFASVGVMTVRTGSGAWVVPTDRAVWIPAKVPHTIAMSGTVAMRTLYLKPRLAKGLPKDCCVVSVSPLLRELILQACAFGALRREIPRQKHVTDLVLDQLEAVPMIPLRLPKPVDPRAQRVAGLLEADPSDARPLAEICRVAGAGKRTMERTFKLDVGMTFGKWRQQVRLMHAMRLLAEGSKVTYAAVEAGYSTPSAFISMFRKALGMTPREYFQPPELKR